MESFNPLSGPFSESNERKSTTPIRMFISHNRYISNFTILPEIALHIRLFCSVQYPSDEKLMELLILWQRRKDFLLLLIVNIGCKCHHLLVLGQCINNLMKLSNLLLLLLRLKKLGSSKQLPKDRVISSRVIELIHRRLLLLLQGRSTTIQWIMKSIQKIYLILRTSIPATLCRVQMMLTYRSLGRGIMLAERSLLNA